tara:strand:- start:163 stop:501 length:339 start_codon:yes stop_codon:yes gene_type:complete
MASGQSKGTAAMTIRSKAKGVKEEPTAQVIAAEGGEDQSEGGVIVEYERSVWRKGDGEGREGRRTNMRTAILRTNMKTAILSHEEMEGSRFLLPLTEGIGARMREAVLRMMT